MCIFGEQMHNTKDLRKKTLYTIVRPRWVCNFEKLITFPSV